MTLQKSMGEITNVVEESIIGHRLVKIFEGHKYETNLFDSVNKNNRERNLKLIFYTKFKYSTYAACHSNFCCKYNLFRYVRGLS